MMRQLDKLRTQRIGWLRIAVFGAVSTKAEAGLYSEAVVIEQQERQAQP